MEIELKFAVDGEDAFDALIRHLDLPAREFLPSSLQVNHFFDTPDFALEARRVSLRLREEGSTYLLTLKANEETTTPDGVATRRIEEEVHLSPSEAVDVLRGSVSPRDAFAQRLSASKQDTLALLDDAIGSSELHYVGQFENLRIHLPSVDVPLPDGTTLPLSFELDRSSFTPPTFEHEIEVELPPTADLHQAHTAVVSLLSAAAIPWRPTTSKAKRFFASLRG